MSSLHVTVNKSQRRLNLLKDQLTKQENKHKTPVRVLITGAVGNIGYALCFMVAQGRAFGHDQPVVLHLLDLPMFKENLRGLEMELLDGAFPLVKGIVATTEPEVGFKNIEYAILCGAKPRSKGMERKDLLTANAAIFKQQGKMFDTYANKNVKVCVVGNPANTNALILIKNAPTINPNNFTALTRLDHNRMVSQLSTKLNMDNNVIKNVAIWGNHSSTQYPNLDYGVYEQDCGNNLPLVGLINDKSYIEGELIKTVQQRGAKIIEARKSSSAASAASSACDHMRDWVNGTNDSTWTSMGVYSRGEYGAVKDVVFSFPVYCKEGEWKIAEGLKLSDFAKEKLAITGKELNGEKEMALSK